MKRRTFLKSASAAAALAASGAGVTLTHAQGTGFVLLDPWTGPYDGVPPFDKVKASDLKPSLLKAVEMARAEITAIAEQSEPATFQNTNVRMQDSGRPLDRATNIFGVFSGNLNDDTVKDAEKVLSPAFAAYQDEVVQNEKLFARIKTVYEARETSSLTPEEQRIAQLNFESFQRQGAGLDAAKKTRLKEINKRLAELTTQFSQNQLGDEDKEFVTVDKEADLAGLSDGVKTGLAEDAKRRGKAGKWTVANTRSSAQPVLTFSENRALREKVFKMWNSRGNNNNAYNNRETAKEILKLRQEKAKLLGHPTFAHWQLANNMAKTPDAALALMTKVWKPAIAQLREEVKEAQELANKEGGTFKLAAWDLRFYQEKVRKDKYAFDETEVSQYLQLDKMVEAIFFSANKVFGLEFKKITNVPVFHPDVTAYEVTQGGKHKALFYFDPFARPGKRSGAWMTSYRDQERFKKEVTPIVSNNCNYVKGKPGEPVLISWDDANTLFHEFGHALHGMLSNVTYPSVSGTAVKRDFVEFPSQIMERWLETPEVLNTYCLHYKTGKPIPADLVAKIKKARNFGQGFSTSEYLANALYDMKLHMSDASAGIDIVEFEKKVIAEIGLPEEIVLRHPVSAFGHIFAGDGYSAGYYVYIWADTLSADTIEAFKEAGSLFHPATAKKFHDTIMSVGGSVAPDQAFRNFRGRDVDTNALMRERGFPVT